MGKLVNLLKLLAVVASSFSIFSAPAQYIVKNNGNGLNELRVKLQGMSNEKL